MSEIEMSATEHLAKVGPVVTVKIEHEGKSWYGLALVDTGASATLLDESVIEALGLEKNGDATVSDLHGADHEVCPTYAAKLDLPNTGMALTINRVVAVDMLERQVGHRMVIGRDVLKEAQLVYSGASGEAVLTFFTKERLGGPGIRVDWKAYGQEVSESVAIRDEDGRLTGTRSTKRIQ